MKSKKPDFEKIQNSRDISPFGRALAWYAADSDYEKLCAIEDLMDQTYRLLVENRRVLSKMDRGEDEITIQIVQMLKSAGVDATHNTYFNGHCDIVVTHSENYMWIAEAKILRGRNSLLRGFLQLSTRYGTATPHRDHGEIIIYNKKGNSTSALREWKKGLLESIVGVQLAEDKIDSGLFFRTEHKCPNSGLTFHVRHVIVPLQHSPLS